ncbi:TIGR01777 family oxidoreductase [Janibacter sp. GXQ6167]|uniref:TIGR01777 family oxidoreductase n=1 Tax=Janibacter sp. GXQ6167 TaxID=3240791 RepID=UPI00352459DC
MSNANRQRVAIAGSSGLIGGALSSALRERGDDVVALVRRAPRADHERQWDPDAGDLDPGHLADVDVVVNLAGAGVGDKRWTPEYKREILTSRTTTTGLIARRLAEGAGPRRLVNASAVGFYGDRGEETLTETSPAGHGFLAEVVRAWEAATQPASEAGIPVAMSRTGLVFAPEGGALAPLLTLGKFGLAGPLGSGRQWWPWISLTDEVNALIHLIDHPEITGPVNLTAPSPERQKVVAQTLGQELSRPAVLPAPAFAMRIAVGEFAGEILASTKALPTVLEETGYRFTHEDIRSALRWITAR